MRYLRPLGILFLVAFLAVVLTTSGCGKKEEKKGDDDKKGESEDNGDGTGDSTEKTELTSTGWGSLSGTVTFDGEIPDRPVFEDAKKHKDAKVCAMGDIRDQKWMVQEKNGKKVVANVVVWIRPPANKYFKLPAQPFWNKEVIVDQPHCAFIPHVSVAYPKGQKIKIKNSAPMTHNTNYSGTPTINPGDKPTLTPKDSRDLDLRPDTQPITLSCNLHQWMKGYIWVLDHPYAAVSDKDGKFEIAQVPAGVEVNVVVWHEVKGFLYGPKGKPMKLKAGKNPLPISISK